jgi:hypothetical protein
VQLYALGTIAECVRWWSCSRYIQLIQQTHACTHTHIWFALWLGLIDTSLLPRMDLFYTDMWCLHDCVQGTSYENMTIIVQNYVQSLISKYPYWNRTLGADHFFVTCHDVGVRATEGVELLVKNSIRVVLPKLWCWIHSTQRCCSSSSIAAICSSSWRKWSWK